MNRYSKILAILFFSRVQTNGRSKLQFKNAVSMIHRSINCANDASNNCEVVNSNMYVNYSVTSKLQLQFAFLMFLMFSCQET